MCCGGSGGEMKGRNDCGGGDVIDRMVRLEGHMVVLRKTIEMNGRRDLIDAVIVQKTKD